MEIDFLKGEYVLVDKQHLPFTVKGKNELILFKQKEGCDYYAFESGQLSDEEGKFFKFCMRAVHPVFYQFKYGDDFFSEAKEFHEDNEAYRLSEGLESQSYDYDFKNFELNAEKEFQEGLGENRLYPAIVVKKGGIRWKQYNDFMRDSLAVGDNKMILEELKRHSIALFCLEQDGTLTLLRHFTQDLSYYILRGKDEIGNLIELNYGSIKILLDCGKELNENLEEDSELEKMVLSKNYDGVLISHYHIDHAGLVGKVKCPIYMGKGCLKVLNAQNNYKNEPLLKNINCFEPNEEFAIKKNGFEIKVKPILVDHSAYDSYMFLIRGGGKTLLYTGDFRAHGRKNFSQTLKNLPNKVDVLICEATNMFCPNENMLEEEVEMKATQLMKDYKHVFVFQAGTNIDRLVSFYKASIKNKKVFLMDTYVSGICENLPNIPNPKTFKDVYCFWDVPKRFGRDGVRKYEIDWRQFHKLNKGLGYCDVGSPKNENFGDLSNFTMIVRPSMLNYLKRADEDKLSRFKTSIFDNSILIYSLWQGYKEKDDVKSFLEEMEKMGVKIVDLHTSGHCDKQTIDRLKQKVNPSIIEYVHFIKKAL